MGKAYALLGLAFIVVFGGAYLLWERAHAPTLEKVNPTTPMSLTLASSAFAHNGSIPSQYTCDGENTLPPLSITDVPEGTVSLVLVMDDPDIPEEIKTANNILKFNHFAVYNIPPDTTDITADSIPGTPALNTRGEEGYTGPCPPPEYEPKEHRYIFRLYAIEGTLSFEHTPTLDEVETAAKGQIIEQAELIGRYERTNE
ncbi:MAG: YbhB/YbcL family Raf kinase inhibitor-like protein [Candidatus Paceibacterota bacterium]